MSANTHTTEPEERKPPTIADIVREKTGDGALIIDFFTDVMTGRIEGAELCHRIDAAKQLVKYGSKDAAEFLAKYKGVPCGHSINGRPDPADPCSAEDRSLVAVTLNAPPTLTRDFLTVLSGIDEFLMARLIRAQTVDGVTIIEFLDDVMQDRTDGFKTHHRIAAAKELIVHIVRDEQPSHTPSPSTTPSPLSGEGWGEGDSYVVPAQAEGNPDNTIVVPAKAGTQGRGVARPSEVGAHAELNSPVVPAEAGTQGGRSTAANPAHPEPNPSVVPANTIVVPAKAGTHPRTVAMGEPATEQPGADTQSPNPDPAEGPQDKARRPRTRRTRTQRRRDGAAKAATLGKGPERNKEEKQDEKLQQHWHEPDPHTAHPSTPHTPAAHRPGNRDPTSQLNSERGRGLLPPLPRRERAEPALSLPKSLPRTRYGG